MSIRHWPPCTSKHSTYSCYTPLHPLRSSVKAETALAGRYIEPRHTSSWSKEDRQPAYHFISARLLITFDDTHHPSLSSPVLNLLDITALLTPSAILATTFPPVSPDTPRPVSRSLRSSLYPQVVDLVSIRSCFPPTFTSTRGLSATCRHPKWSSINITISQLSIWDHRH
jgi:hypothetical protein